MKHYSLYAAGMLLTCGVVSSMPASAADPTTASSPKSPLDFTVNDIDGKPVNLSKYKGNVVLIVNTATQCGFRKQIGGLEDLYEKYKDKGLKVLAFPENDFGQQEPGTDAQIKATCTAQYKTTYELFSKIVVKGEGQAALYSYLTGKDTDPKFAGNITWNFNKFLVNRQGKVVARFGQTVDPMGPQVTVAVEDALAEPQPEGVAPASTN